MRLIGSGIGAKEQLGITVLHARHHPSDQFAVLFDMLAELPSVFDHLQF
jgi:hypothetical protein